MKKINADVVIIGGGTAGMTAFRAARTHTESVYLIENHQFGTTCARVGCMPSKLLIAAAEARHHALHTAQFGIHLDENSVRVDSAEVMQRVKSERDRFVGFVLEDVEEKFPAENKILGKAKFIDQNTVQVDDHTEIRFQRAVIATGSRPVVVPDWQKLGDKLIVNDDVFAWDTLPESVAVFGAGVIGLELGQALHRLGVRVSIFGANDSIGGISDPVVWESAKAIFGAELDLNLNTNSQVSLENDKVVVRFEKDGKAEERTFDYLLSAIGRKPNTDQIGLENVPLQCDNRGVPIANRHTMQTNLHHIFIAGDASNQLPLLHEAADQGFIAGNNAGAYPDISRGLRRSAIGVIFSNPQIASIGSRFAELSAQYREKAQCWVTGEVSFHNQGRSRVMGINQGCLRVYAEQGTGRFLGAEMVGPAAEHIAHLLAWAHQQKMTIPQILDMPFYHPVIEEGVRTALRDVNSKLTIADDLLGECCDCPGE